MKSSRLYFLSLSLSFCLSSSLSVSLFLSSSVLVLFLLLDGAELLLDLGLPATIIGGIVLPLLGAVPDSAMIIASGSSGDAEEADSQIAVGMGFVIFHDSGL